MKVDRPNQRRPDGNIESMMKDENWYELVVGDKSRSGGQWDIWEATYSPVGSRRLPEAALGQGDRRDRQVRRRAVEEVRPARTSSRRTGRRSGRRSPHKLNVYVGDMDSYYLNDAVEKLNEFLVEGRQPEVHGRDRLPAARAALLGTARAGAAAEDGGADRESRAGRRGSEVVEIPLIAGGGSSA